VPAGYKIVTLNNFNNSVTLAGTSLRLPEDDAGALKYVGVLTIYKILLIYIYVCCAFVGLHNKIDFLICSLYFLE
jgi:hypothetical protein